MKVQYKVSCYHCGEDCIDETIQFHNKSFCCVGCKSVYSILNQHQLDGYYCLNENPGNSFAPINEAKFQFLDDPTVADKIISFKNEKQTQVQLYLPHIHCSSCLWLLENLHKLNEGIISSQVNFGEKKVSISFYHQLLSIRKLAELLASIGYEPYITLQDYDKKSAAPKSRKTAIKLGLAGFCFANIMLISFPEYLGLEYQDNALLLTILRYTNLFLSLPIVIYGAQEFYQNAWSSLKHRFLNIDAPIALAISITFIRSVYEIVSNTGAGYLDSMSGIVFFMLIGRSLQHKTHTNLKFNRDFQSFFPISVTVIKDHAEIVTRVQDIKEEDLLELHHQEIIPIDCMLSSRAAEIDYSFVTGENEIVKLKTGELIYAGGKIMNTAVEVIAVKEFSQNSFTELWNNQIFKKSSNKHADFIDTISKYFALVLLCIAFSAFIYWQYVNPENAWNAMTAVLIVACPCTLLLASTYTFGFIIELFAEEGLFVKNPSTLININKINHIVFDKTGTLSDANQQNIKLQSQNCGQYDIDLVISALKQSTHPLSKVIANNYPGAEKFEIANIKETEGQGLEAWYCDAYIKIGKAEFIGIDEINHALGSCIYFSIDNSKTGYFEVSHIIKNGIEGLINKLKPFKLSLLSGDNVTSATQMKSLFPQGSEILFQQTPQQKLDHIKHLQAGHQVVMMVGDGINDAGALKQSDVGISIVNNSFSFSPASDAILNASQVSNLYRFIGATKDVKNLIIGTFIYSLIYNTIGISIAVSANMKPVLAAILMPASSISVILIAFVGTKWIHKKHFGTSI